MYECLNECVGVEVRGVSTGVTLCVCTCVLLCLYVLVCLCVFVCVSVCWCVCEREVEVNMTNRSANCDICHIALSCLATYLPSMTHAWGLVQTGVE